MSVNSYKPHLLVLPEDKANSDMANGFILNSNLNLRAIQMLPLADGWNKVVDKFNNNLLPDMRKFSERRVLLLMDFDGKPEDRLSFVHRNIPEDIKNRVFVLGVWSEPEKLKKDTGKSFETIGNTLANECAENKQDLWNHDLLKHNEDELKRLIKEVKPFLFNSS